MSNVSEFPHSGRGSLRQRTWCIVLTLVLVAALSLVAIPTPAQAAELPTAQAQQTLAATGELPGIDGPIPIDENSHPFNGAAWQNKPIDLAAYGFVEEEYFINGKANVYDWVPGTDYELSTTSSADYTTRALVRQPADRRDFSGKVVVEIINMSAGYDWTAMWSALWESIVANGDAYIGITSKPNVFDGMKRFDNARYERLSMPNPVPPEQQACGTSPGDPNYDPNLSTAYENGLIWDILSQTGALLKSKDQRNPLPKPAKRVFLTGESQSGNYAITYFKWFQNGAKHKKHGKKAPYDGYLLEAAVNPTPTSAHVGAPINQCANITNPLPADDPQLTTIPGRGVPLMMLQSQWDYWPIRGYERKPDSNTKTDMSRTWELAGAHHGWEWQYLYGDANAADLIKAGFWDPASYAWSCGPNNPEVPLYMAEKAAYAHLDRWAQTNGRIAPPTAEPIRNDGGEVFDQYGNVEGGLRLPMLQAPVASYGVGKYALSGDCPEIQPLSTEQLGTLYSSKADYVAQYTAAADNLVRRGYLLAGDAEKLIAQAQQVATIPGG